MSKMIEVDVKIMGDQDGEHLPIKCVCGYGDKPWEFVIDIYSTNPSVCSSCGRSYFFRDLGVQVYLIEDDYE